MNRMIRHAQQTFLAMKDPYKSVEKVYPQAIHAAERFEEVHYVGIKNVPQIPAGLIRKLKAHGYEPHTLDRCSVGGRAVDIGLTNPLTGNKMTGSSSGTAVNVFLGINDLGIGTDGGGSVLAPAMSLQCFGFISPLLEKEHMKRYEKKSTDGLCFTPSLGFIARELAVIQNAVKVCMEIEPDGGPAQVICSTDAEDRLSEKGPGGMDVRKFPDFDNQREPMIDFLRQTLPECDMLVHYEKKIDVYGMGDSIIGHFDEEMQAMQLRSGKFLIRAANMAGATALSIPDTALASGYVLLCESVPEKIAKLMGLAEVFPRAEDELIGRYFRNADAYFPYGAWEGGLTEL